MLTQDAEEDRVEGTHTQLSCSGADMLADAVAHLSGGLVGEGQSHEPPRMIARVDEVEDLVDEDTGLATASPSDD